MAKTARNIAVRDMHRREYRRTMRWIVMGSIALWFVLVILLAGSDAGGAIVPMSIILLVGIAVARVTLWSRYRRDMRAELMQDTEDLQS